MSSVRSSRRVRSGHSILTAVLVASTVFSAMTLPLVMQQPVPVLMDFPPQWNETPPSRMDRETRNSIIRYLGIAIVSSVGSGLGAVELLRRQYRAKLRLQQAESGLQEERFLADSDLEAAYITAVPGAIESSSYFAEPTQSSISSAFSEDLLVKQNAPSDYRTEYGTEASGSVAES